MHNEREVPLQHYPSGAHFAIEDYRAEFIHVGVPQSLINEIVTKRPCMSLTLTTKSIIIVKHIE